MPIMPGILWARFVLLAAIGLLVTGFVWSMLRSPE
jgi:hypothetical protein